MKFPLLGIIIVVLLQLGFTAFNAIDRPIGSLVVADPLTSGTNPIASIFETPAVLYGASERVNITRRPDSGDTIPSASNWRRKLQNIQPSPVYLRKNNGVGKLKGMSQLVAERKPFESTVITYPRVILATSDSENFSITTASAKPSESEKRTFVSKTVSIIKKPYKWIKALGAKLN